jgi:hypothetical protein
MEQLIREILIEVPGASIRWLWFRGKRKFSELLTDKSAYNVILSFVVIGIIVLAILYL